MPAASRSATSSRIASAICRQVIAARTGRRARTTSCRIVTGPVSMPFIGWSVSDCAYAHHSTVIGFGPRDVAVDDRRPHAARAVSSAPSRVCVKAKPASCSPKYWTMSLRSNSPWTSTSRPSVSCQRTARAVSVLQEALVVRCRSARPCHAPRGPCGFRRLRKRADGGGRKRRQVEAPRCCAAARCRMDCWRRRIERAMPGDAARDVRHRESRATSCVPMHRRPTPVSASFTVPRLPSSAVASDDQFFDFLRRECQPVLYLRIEVGFQAEVDRHVQERAGRCDLHMLACQALATTGVDAVERCAVRSARQILRPSITPSEITRSAGHFAAMSSSCSGARTRSICRPGDRKRTGGLQVAAEAPK